jgi:hypothetical protein
VTHREKSLTPWLKAAKDMTDDEKHEFTRLHTGFNAVYLPPSVFAAAERAGYDMRYYIVQKSMPVTKAMKS